MADRDQPSRGGEYLRALALVVVTTGVCLALRPYLATVDIAMLLLLSVVAVAGRYQRGPAIFASIFCIAVFDLLFVPPYYALSVSDSAYYLTFAVMLTVALAMSRLTARIREQREAAAERERRTNALFALDRDLTEAADPDSLLASAASHIARVAEGTVTFLRFDDVDRSAPPRLPTEGAFTNPVVQLAASWAIAHEAPAGWGTATYPDSDIWMIPLRGAAGLLGLAAVHPGDPDRGLGVQTRGTVSVLVEHTAVALERRLLTERSDRDRIAVHAEKLRSALLSSLSHDMRSPLASIEGAASSLLENRTLPPKVQRELLETILEESQRMTRLITNLLNIVRVETGMLSVQKSWQPLEEALGVALLRLDDRLRQHPVNVQLPKDLPMVPIDELLIEQVFLNLLENAIRHTAPGTPVEITATAEPGRVLVEVADRGPGIEPGQEEVVFNRFYRASSEPVGDGGAGSGLGLTICRGIITAHGGRIWIEQRPGGGAVIRFTIPLAGAPMASLPVDAPLA